MSAKLIMFDGPDGVGKTTQIKLATDELQREGRRVYTTRINGGSPMGEALRTVFLSELERPAATDYHLGMAIFEAFVAEIDQLRDEYDIILVDRSPLSNVTYQSFGSGYSLDITLEGCDQIMDKLEPDLLICYTAPLQTLRERLGQVSSTKADYFENKPDAFFEKVIEGYAFVTERFGATTVDASGDEAAIHQSTMALIRAI